MNEHAGNILPNLLRSRNPDVRHVIDCFITRFNTASGNPASGRWDIAKEEWQRYEFLGDRVLNLVIARHLFSRRECVLDEGDMTKILSSVVSNQALSALANRIDPVGFARLIPISIGEQNTYGKRVIGGAFEAFIGALYCETGLEDVSCFITHIMTESLNAYDPQGNAIGLLQEYYQKQGMSVPVYEHIASSRPSHQPQHTYRVLTPEGKTFDGNGPNSSEAKQRAARAALRHIRNSAGGTVLQSP